MRFLLIGAMCALAGCASQTPANQASNWQVCEYMMDGGHNAQVAQAEARRRNLDCRSYFPAILSKRQAEAAEDAAAAQILRNMQPSPAMPSPTNCSTTIRGSRADTSCW
jgi:hypothetical protein